MGKLNIVIQQGTPPYVISVKKVGDPMERWTSGGTSGDGEVIFTSDIGSYNYNLVVSKTGCTSFNRTFNLSCGNIPTPVNIPSPVSTPVSPTPVVVPSPVITPTPVSSCDISISNLIVNCYNSSNATVTVMANSPSGKTLRYGILGFANYQVSNVFDLPNSANNGDANGYTFIVAELNNESACNNRRSMFLNCTTPVTPTAPTPINVPTPVSAACDIVINNINIQCNPNTTATVTVSASSASGKSIRYGILGFVDYQVSNVFNLNSSDANGYTFIAAEFGNESNCNSRQNRVVICTTPVSPTPVTPVPTPTPVPTSGTINWNVILCPNQGDASGTMAFLSTTLSLAVGDYVKDNQNQCWSIAERSNITTPSPQGTIVSNGYTSCSTCLSGQSPNPSANSFFILNREAGNTSTVGCSNYASVRASFHAQGQGITMITTGLVLYYSSTFGTGNEIADGYYSDGTKVWHFVGGSAQSNGVNC